MEISVSGDVSALLYSYKGLLVVAEERAGKQSSTIY